MRVGILNVTGYAGLELIRLLAWHPELQIVAVTGRSQAGKTLAEVFPFSDLFPNGELSQMTITEEILASVDIVFSGLPHKASAEALLPFIQDGVPVVDIAADFRLRDPETYKEWYQDHPCAEYLENAVYGLTELHREEVRQAKIVANPGCYPTGAILGLAPAVAEGIVAPSVIVDAKSGISGGGRSLTLTNHFSEVNESVEAYALTGHRHMPEIVQELSAAADADVQVTFVPHLIPMTRGILATCYATLDGPTTQHAVDELYQARYGGEPFVQVLPVSPKTKWTYGSNHCLIHPVVHERTGHLIVTTAIDNLVKGASGQALQNANAMLGLPETMGLETKPLYP
jgi:N-acetyl-gamma-glutamyl-phosphate reductase